MTTNSKSMISKLYITLKYPLRDYRPIIKDLFSFHISYDITKYSYCILNFMFGSNVLIVVVLVSF